MLTYNLYANIISAYANGKIDAMDINDNMANVLKRWCFI